MSRSLFFVIIAVVGLFFAGPMLLAPSMFALSAGLSASAENAFLFRALGGMILSVTIANFLVRNHPESATLAAVLWMNLAFHVLAIAIDLLGVVQGLITIAHFVPGLVVHAAIAFGAFYYINRISPAR